MNILAAVLVEPETLTSYPFVVQAFIIGLGVPLPLWGIVFLAQYVRRGHSLVVKVD